MGVFVVLFTCLKVESLAGLPVPSAGPTVKQQHRWMRTRAPVVFPIDVVAERRMKDGRTHFLEEACLGILLMTVPNYILT